MVQNEKTTEVPSLGGEQSPSPVSGEVCAEAPGPVEESGIAVETTGLRKFISGVVEGKNDTKSNDSAKNALLNRDIFVDLDIGGFKIHVFSHCRQMYWISMFKLSYIGYFENNNV